MAKRPGKPKFGPWPEIPDDVVDWFRTVFADANNQTSARLLNIPNIRETSLDDTIIDVLQGHSGARAFGSGARISMEVHNIGGLRHWKRWEIADIGVIVSVSLGSNIVARKIGLLQAKRLYPASGDIQEEDSLDFLYGMNKTLLSENKSTLRLVNHVYEFNEECSYTALNVHSQQSTVMKEFQAKVGEAVFYLFYNPPSVPVTVDYPLRGKIEPSDFPLGCRVYSITDVENGQGKTGTPTLATLQNASPQSNWPLETWAADLLLRCKVGMRFKDGNDAVVQSLIVRRSGPIAAAVSVEINLPGD